MFRPRTIWPLAVGLLLLAIGGIYGGTSLIIDPTGELLGVAATLPQLPVASFLWPGLFLVTVMGLAPAVLAYAFLVQPRWPRISRLFRWNHHYWAWTATMSLMAILAVWLAYEGALMGFFAITYFTSLLGIVVFLLALSPSIRDYYSWRNKPVRAQQRFASSHRLKSEWPPAYTSGEQHRRSFGDEQSFSPKI